MTDDTSAQRQIERLQERIQKLEEENRKWMRLAGINRITGLPNSLMLYQVMLPRELAKAADTPIHLACVLLCPDGIGEINQQHGRAVGDQLLKNIGAFLGHQVESSEQLYHCDGANFAILMPASSEGRGRRRAALVINQFKKERFTIGEVRLRNMTCSAGVAEVEGTVERGKITQTIDRLYLELCDRLYEAKQRGGDYVMGPPGGKTA